jgi:hypothetical protein
VIGVALIVVLLTLSALHLYWGLGGRWPGHDAASLREMVVGTRGSRMYEFGPSAMVAVALAAAALIVLWGQSPLAGGLHVWIVYGGYAVLILVFGLRGLATYLTPIFDYARGTAFFDLNRQIYSPLCLAIALGLIVTYPPGLGNMAR